MKEINIVTLLRNFGPKKLALMHKFGKIPKDAALSPVMKHNA